MNTATATAPITKPATTAPATRKPAAAESTSPPNLMFSHMGFAVKDIDKMEDFYSRVLGFTTTDKGEVLGMDLRFMSRDPRDHHQIVLASGKPDNIPPNPYAPQFGSVINQISFRVASLDELRKLHKLLLAENLTQMFIGNHGVAWSIYCHDPEGNNLEFFVDTPWFFPQPFLVPLDFTKTNDEIRVLTEDMAREQTGFEMATEWQLRMRPMMNVYRPVMAAI